MQGSDKKAAAQATNAKSFNRAGAAHGGGAITAPHEAVNFTDRFDFMVPNLEPNAASDDELMALGSAMFEPEEAQDGDPINNHRLPSGYTYFGQYIDHDLTFDPLSVLGGPNKLDDFQNFRTPRFDLDSLYGHGPHDQPYMYDGPLFRTGVTKDDKVDLLRIDPGREPQPGDKLAVIGDKRNDENLIVSQIQLAFILYHNRVVADLQAMQAEGTGGITDDNVFDLAHQIVLWRYQHIVLFDYLRRLILPKVFDDLRQHGPRFFHVPKGVFMPLEFAVAAFRMGHSMVRFNYTLNATTDGHELDIFADTADKDLRGFRPRPIDRTITWTRFLEFEEKDGPGGTATTQYSMALDSGLAGSKPTPPPAPPQPVATALADLPPDVPENPELTLVLAQRNLLRGRHLGRGLPSGQTLARHLGVHTADILRGERLKVTRSAVVDAPSKKEADGRYKRSVDQALTDLFKDDTPLWYYILKEAEQLGLRADDAHPLGAGDIPMNADETNGGRTMGPLGSRIVGEVFFKLLLKDPESILSATAAMKVPAAIAGPVPAAGKFGAADDGVFTLADLINYAHRLQLTPLRPAPFGVAEPVHRT